METEFLLLLAMLTEKLTSIENTLDLKSKIEESDLIHYLLLQHSTFNPESFLNFLILNNQKFPKEVDEYLNVKPTTKETLKLIEKKISKQKDGKLEVSTTVSLFF